ncbi:hypothetical protein ACHAXT_001627 [Thalassiosira profunda]
MGFIGRHPLVSMAWSLLLSFGARTAAAGLQIRAAFAAGGVAICNPSTHQARTSTSRLHSTSEPLKTLEGSDIYAAEEVIKKSRFIGLAAHCTNWDDAQSILESVRKDHPKSRHACFGFVSSAGAGGEGVGTERCSDDGEPTGTAGVPILGAIKGEGLSDTLCIVVRYSGGIKLGAGGLIRAYGGAARLALRSAPTQIHVPKSSIRISTRAANSGAVYAAAAKYGGVTSGEAYNDRGELEVTITCDEENGERLREEMKDATRGGVMFIE